MRQIVSLILLTTLLQSCVFVAGAAAGAAAIAIVYDHRSIQSTFDDNKMSKRIVDRMQEYDDFWKQSHIGVTVFNKVVLLTGQTPRREWRQLAGEIAKDVSHEKVYNQISVEGPASSITRASDSWISTKVRSLMLAEPNLKSSSIKVITENGVVYLMGVVTRKQANMAVDIARKVSGVQRVIKIFSYTK